MGEAHLTQRQTDVLTFITEYHAEHGTPPTISEIGGALGIMSKSTTHAHILSLVQKGKLSPRKLRGATAYYPTGAGSFAT